MALGTSRLLARAAGITLASGMIAAGLAAPALASTTTAVTNAHWAHTDSATPSTAFTDTDGDLPIGAQAGADGVDHVSKAYVTIALSQFVGHTVQNAYLDTVEQTVADCTKPRDTQVWLTDSAGAPTWAQPPSELEELPGPPRTQDSCPSPRVEWDATKAVQDALTGGSTSATFVLRLPDSEQSDPAFGRTVDHAVKLVVQYNHAPGTPTSPVIDQHPCAAQPVLVNGGDTASKLSVVPNDADNDQMTTEFNWWPVDHPDQRTSLQTSAGANGAVESVTVQHSSLSDGGTYAWQARSNDGQETGPWSDVCEFTTDFTAPSKPTVSSPDYPPNAGGGGVGVPGRFTFSANGSSDVVGFQYGSDFPITYVAADRAGGSATIWITPNTYGVEKLVVKSVDAAGNTSAITTYQYFVNNNRPQVSCTPASGYIGVARQCTFSPNINRYVGYTYQVGNGAPVSVDADADGNATVTVTPMSTADQAIVVRGRMYNGNLSDSTYTGFQLDFGTPRVDQSATEVTQGSPVQFTLHSVLPGSTSFVYTWGGGQPVTVAVGADGTATLTLIADEPGFEEFDVYTTTPSGAKSDTAFDMVMVD
jgi:hypothetical protein